MTDPEQTPPWKFVRDIRNKCRAIPGARQDLAQPLGNPERATLALRFIPSDILRHPFRDKRYAYITVSGLIAAHDPTVRMNRIENRNTEEEEEGEEEPENTQGPQASLGSLFAQLDLNGGLAGEGGGPAARRMHRLLHQDLEGLHKNLPRHVKHFTQKGLIPNWSTLLKDISFWGNHESRTKTIQSWSYAYYRTLQGGKP